MIAEEINYCPRCGTAVVEQVRIGRVRLTCPNCDWIYFPDPKVAVAVILEKDERVLLVRRAIDPQRGRWTLPAGFVDAGEDPQAAAARECLEETGLTVGEFVLYDVLAGQEHPKGAHILIVYRAQIQSGNLSSSDDVDQAEFFSRKALPPLAFASTEKILKPRSDSPNTGQT